jgi:hypothetical protein
LSFYQDFDLRFSHDDGARLLAPSQVVFTLDWVLRGEVGGRLLLLRGILVGFMSFCLAAQND